MTNRLVYCRLSLYAQKLRTSQVYFGDLPLIGEGQIAYRSKVIEIGVAISGLLQGSR